jgi:hypothetical protein
MSSSRSIAAARNRRAGEQQPVQSRSGPGTSIASQAAFVQQMQQDQRFGQQQGGRIRMPQNGQMQQTQQIQQPQQMGPAANGVPSGVKLSISDAIGLITLRLGKVEQFIIDLENQTLPSLRGTTNNAGTQPIDISVINSIVNRLDNLEKSQREINLSTIGNSSNKEKPDYSHLEKEIRDIKDALMVQMVKYDKFSDTTNQKISDIHQRLTDIDNAFVEFENQFNVESLNAGMQISNLNDVNLIIESQNNDTERYENDDNEEVSSNVASDNIISSVDLKSMIKEELKEL